MQNIELRETVFVAIRLRVFYPTWYSFIIRNDVNFHRQLKANKFVILFSDI